MDDDRQDEGRPGPGPAATSAPEARPPRVPGRSYDPAVRAALLAALTVPGATVLWCNISAEVQSGP